MKRLNLKGKKFGRLTAVEYAGYVENGKTSYWKCICECGEESVVATQKLTTGHTKSCGCLRTEALDRSRTTHGKSKTRTYKIWKGMHYRCENPNHDKYHRYGGRGIRVCKRWGDFENFYEDMGEAPKGMSIDRIENDGNYEPNNCRWTTQDTQARSYSRYLTLHGITMSLSQWSKKTGIKKATLSNRLRMGWSDEEALTRNVRSLRRSFNKGDTL